MDITTVGPNPYAYLQNRSATVDNAHNNGDITALSEAEDEAETNANPALMAATIAAPRVSHAVNRALLQLQDSGRIFNGKDASLMNARGVSDEERQRFAEIVQNAAETGAYNDPIAHIKSLPPEDVEVLRRVHSLAERRGVTDTNSKEGAINLLLPPEHHVDINDDGLVGNGTGTMFRFPPPNAPQSVKDAWEQTTLNMSPAEKMMADATFFGAMISANVKTDGNGNPIGLYDHTDPEYKNVFPTSEGEWALFLRDYIDEHKRGVSRQPSQQAKVDLLTTFLGNIQSSSHAVETAKTDSDSKAAAAAKINAEVKEEFLDFVNMTPEERMFALLLAEEGLTAEQFKALPPDERAKIEQKIHDKIQERLGKKTTAIDVA